MFGPYKTLLPFILLFASTLWAQRSTLDSLEQAVQEKDIDRALILQAKLTISELLPFDQAKYFDFVAQTFEMNDETDKAYELYLRAKDAYYELDSFRLEAEINLKLAGTIISMEKPTVSYKPYLRDCIAYAESMEDSKLLSKAYFKSGSALIDTLPRETLRFYKKALNENTKTGDTLFRAKLYHNTAVLCSERLAMPDSSLFYFDEAYKAFKNQQETDYMAYVHIGKASLLRQEGRYEDALTEYRTADSLPLREFRKTAKSLLHGFMAGTHEENSDYTNAYVSLKTHMALNDSIKELDQQENIAKIQAKYDVEKKENENLLLKENRNRWVAALVGVTLMLIIAFVSYRNARHKRKILESQKELQTRTLEKVLKEQELNGIDAMIEGQEKERQRIAHDLHDNLGSILATIKLHFQNLKIRKERIKEEEDTLLKKTDDLIEEAYQKVRSIAHARNAGVSAQEGLLPAVKNFASKVSIANNLVIEVEDHGMDKRLENSLEITLFRIIQELITNIIKHAAAKEATIHLTHHKETLNIMVEDDGKGFDMANVMPEEGMGLHSIQMRTEYLKGTLAIDSGIGKGTTVIIDVPIAI